MMSSAIRIVPGLIAAILAFVALELVIFLGSTTLGVHILVFFLVYIFSAFTAEKAMAAYGRTLR